jgi:hypothetical protein
LRLRNFGFIKDKNVLRLVALAIAVFSFITTAQGNTPSSSVTGVTLGDSNKIRL